MKIIAKTLLASSLCILMAVPAHAGRYHDDDHLMDRVERQHQRIVNGVKSGALTRKEVGKLKKQTHKIRSMAREFHEDDALSKKERHILNRKLNKRSDRIWEFKHNDRERHTYQYAFRDTYRDANWHHRHYKHNEHHEDDRGSASCFSDGQSWPCYGFLSW